MTSRSAYPVAYLFRFRAPRDPPCFVSRNLRSRKARGTFLARSLFTRRPNQPVCSHVDVNGISQVPRRSVPCLCLALRPRPNRQSLATHTVSPLLPPRFPRRRLQHLMNFGAQSRGFSTRCLRFTNGVATIHARLASGWLARLYRERVELSGSLQKVSDHPPPLLDLAWRKGSFILNLPLPSHHSITSSARASSVGGTSRPSAPLRCAVRVGGHREVKNGTAGQVGGHPQPTPMGVNDRPANRQPHPHAVRFGRKQWIEYPINGARLNTLPRVLHGHHHTAGVVDFRP